LRGRRPEGRPDLPTRTTARRRPDSARSMIARRCRLSNTNARRLVLAASSRGRKSHNPGEERLHARSRLLWAGLSLVAAAFVFQVFLRYDYRVSQGRLISIDRLTHSATLLPVRQPAGRLDAHAATSGGLDFTGRAMPSPDLPGGLYDFTGRATPSPETSEPLYDFTGRATPPQATKAP
jgi:hypothetical protein